MTSEYAQLQSYLKDLKLNQVLLHLDETIEHALESKESLVSTFNRLFAHEVALKQANRIRSVVKVANFPHQKTLDEYDFSFQPAVSSKQMQDYNSLRFLENKRNIIFMGSSGVGKTHLATSIGVTAAKSGITTYFIKCYDLIQNLKKAKMECRLHDRIKHFNRYKLLILDELGYLPLDKDDASLLFQIIDARYEKKSTIITTNMPFREWAMVLGDERLAHAVVDRLLHHADVVTIKGPSYRLKEHVD